MSMDDFRFLNVLGNGSYGKARVCCAMKYVVGDDLNTHINNGTFTEPRFLCDDEDRKVLDYIVNDPARYPSFLSLEATAIMRKVGGEQRCIVNTPCAVPPHTNDTPLLSPDRNLKVENLVNGLTVIKNVHTKIYFS
ncbi:Hypothetical protein CINCED_3A017322 [Cinara cedri]|uniref:Uncharacterized protein n=1 Tax=Cinara cedri TaxID=506608 RepID=A0A5E4NLM7_9HEMI|nr:Hypothetical protein CINCED_3A017322 [Cinara cedri]